MTPERRTYLGDSLRRHRINRLEAERDALVAKLDAIRAAYLDALDVQARMAIASSEPEAAEWRQLMADLKAILDGPQP